MNFDEDFIEYMSPGLFFVASGLQLKLWTVKKPKYLENRVTNWKIKPGPDYGK